MQKNNGFRIQLSLIFAEQNHQQQLRWFNDEHSLVTQLVQLRSLFLVTAASSE